MAGSNNTAKVNHIKNCLAGLPITVKGLSEYGVTVEVVEDGKSLAENAKKKALAYHQIIGEPVLSMDNGLYFEGVPEKEQPGQHVRRIKGGNERPSDEELIGYYQKTD